MYSFLIYLIDNITMNLKIKLLLIALTLSVSANAQEMKEQDVFKHTAIDTTQLMFLMT